LNTQDDREQPNGSTSTTTNNDNDNDNSYVACGAPL